MNFVNKLQPVHIVKFICYAVIAYLSYILVTYVFYTEVFTAGDSMVYLGLADIIRNKGIIAAADDVRSYGYPLILSIIQQIYLFFSPRGDVTVIIPSIQLIIHAMSSALAVSILDHLNGRKMSLGVKVFVFFLIQFTPMLLGLTRDVLADGITVFFITLFLWSLLSKSRFKYLLASIALSCATVIRPFNGPWGLALLGLLILAAVVHWSISPAVQGASHQILKSIDKKSIIVTSLQILAPIVIIVGFQFYLVYTLTGSFGLVGPRGATLGNGLFWEGTFSFKYETYMGQVPTHSQEIFYKSSVREQLAKQPDLRRDITRISFADPLGTIYVTCVKIIGMFQQYEWSSYRVTLDNQPNLIFWSGLLLFTCFVYVNMDALRPSKFLNRKPTDQKLAVNREGSDGVTLDLSLNLSFLLNLQSALRLDKPISGSFVLWSAINLYIVLYSVFSVPESRYIAPIIPVLIIYAVHTFMNSKDRSNLITAIVISSILYFITYGILLSSIT